MQCFIAGPQVFTALTAPGPYLIAAPLQPTDSSSSMSSSRSLSMSSSMSSQEYVARATLLREREAIAFLRARLIAFHWI